MRYWLMKSEPDAFSIDDLKKRPAQTEAWDGVRNYQARNYMREMKVGDQAFFYHSNCPVPGIVGVMEIACEAYPDPTQFMPRHHHYDPASKPEEPRWQLVDVCYRRHTARVIALEELRRHEAALQGFQLLMKGSRLSVMPVRPEHWKLILKLEQAA